MQRTRRWSFVNDAEGWVAECDVPRHLEWVPGAPAEAGWRKLHRPRATSPQWTARGGTLRATTEPNYYPMLQTGRWAWSGTYADLGLRAGEAAVQVQASYLYRWQVRSRFTEGEPPTLWTSGDGPVCGPLKLAGGGTLVAAVAAPERTEDDRWAAYPVGLGAAGAYVQTDPPTGWGVAQGAAVTLPAGVGPDTAVGLVLEWRLPYQSTSWAGHRTEAVRLKIDEIALTLWVYSGALASTVSESLGASFTVSESLGASFTVSESLGDSFSLRTEGAVSKTFSVSLRRFL